MFHVTSLYIGECGKRSCALQMRCFFAISLGNLEFRLQSIGLTLCQRFVDFGRHDTEQLFVDLSFAVPGQATIGLWNPVEEEEDVK